MYSHAANTYAHSTRIQHMDAALIFVPLIIVMVALPCTAAVAGPPCLQLEESTRDTWQLLEEGNAAFETGDVVKAEACWRQIRECAPATPGWPKAVFNLGLLEYGRKNFPQAIAYFKEVLESHPNDGEPGGSIMETNRNYSNRSALAISQCYEAMGAYGSALRYARLAKTKYPYYSWCGTCNNNARLALNRRIAYLTMRAWRLHILASLVVIGLVALGWNSRRLRHQA